MGPLEVLIGRLSSVSWILKALEHLLADLVGSISPLLFGSRDIAGNIVISTTLGK
jgi:hypothetical protein